MVVDDVTPNCIEFDPAISSAFGGWHSKCLKCKPGFVLDDERVPKFKPDSEGFTCVEASIMCQPDEYGNGYYARPKYNWLKNGCEKADVVKNWNCAKIEDQSNAQSGCGLCKPGYERDQDATQLHAQCRQCPLNKYNDGTSSKCLELHPQ